MNGEIIIGYIWLFQDCVMAAAPAGGGAEDRGLCGRAGDLPSSRTVAKSAGGQTRLVQREHFWLSSQSRLLTLSGGLS